MPTAPSYNPDPLLPYWGMNRPMVLVSGKECFPSSQPMFSTDPASNFYAAAFEVYKTGLELTDEQKMIADHWSDGPGTGTPSGHWIAIISQIAQKDDLSLACSGSLRTSRHRCLRRVDRAQKAKIHIQSAAPGYLYQRQHRCRLAAVS